jgi:general secretion pathway protein B
MSYILDALKKSERDRAGVVQTASSSAPPSAPHTWPRQVWPLALASGLVAGAVVAVIMIWRAPAPDVQEQAGRNAAAPTEAVPLSLSSVAELPPLRGIDSAPASADRTIPQAPVAQITAPAPAMRDDAPFLRQKPAEFQRKLPELAVTIHVYSPEESQRILFINNREYRRGDQVQDGLRVEEIIPDGALLSYHGERFKLRRPY